MTTRRRVPKQDEGQRLPVLLVYQTGSVVLCGEGRAAFDNFQLKQGR